MKLKTIENLKKNKKKRRKTLTKESREKITKSKE